ncbi:MAG: PKD domain-containing protein [Euryarchaeota archaeon]|nr:PKD domain-containing protein [Euryarchaeota archaeon]
MTASLAVLAPAAAAEPSQKPRVDYTAAGAVRAVAMSSDGAFAVAGTADGKLHLFSNGSSTPVWTHPAASAVNVVGMSSDGSRLAAGTEGGKVLLFDRGSSTPVWSAEPGGSATALALSSDGSTVAAGTYLGALALYGASSASPLWNATPGGSVLAVALSATGGSLVAASSDGKLLHYGRSSAESDWNVTLIQSFSSVATSSDGSSIVAGGRDGRIYLMNSAGAPVWNYSTGGSVNCVGISADGGVIAGGASMTNRLYVFSRASSAPLWSAPGGSIVSVALSSDGSYIAAGGYDSQVYLYGRESPVALWTFATGDMVNSVALASDGSLVCSGSENGRFLLLNRTIPNNPPELSAGTVSPSSGTNSTLFVYRVTYTDADDEAPSFIRAVVDGTEYAMTKQDGSDITYTDGAVYELRTTLLVGAHKYRFEASDGKGPVRLPATGDYDGPSVGTGPVNLPPSLAQGRVSPGQGGTTTRFTFAVTYKDEDSDPPAFVALFIDGENRTMKKLNDSPFSTGVEYRLETTLAVADHSFHFEASDGKAPARFPATGELPGPVVSPTAQNNPPALSAPSFSPPGGNTTTLFTFSVVYTDVDDQLPAVKDLVLDGVSRSMSFANGTPAAGSTYTLQTALSQGAHAYHFSFSDGRDAARYPASGDLSTPEIAPAVVVQPPVAVLSVSPLKTSEGGRVVLDGTASTGNITAYFFDFGDGTTSDWVVNAKVEHVYSKAGKYSPKLKVRDNRGQESFYQVGPELSVAKVDLEEGSSPLLLGVVAFLAIAGGGAVVFFIAWTLLRLPGRRGPEK